MHLGDRLASRDNNLNLIRAVAAAAVLVSHAWPITLGSGAAQPLQAMLGVTLGQIAVLVFFALSGFLIAASWQSHQSVARFARARIARLFPGLAVSLCFVAFAIGPAVTVLPVSGYLTHPDTYGFVLRNVLLVPMQFSLPGVFENNPYPDIEGSIWTLFYEAACYAAVALAGVSGLLARRGPATLLIGGVLVAACLTIATEADLPHRVRHLLVFCQPFGLGMLAWVWRHDLPVSPLLLVGLVVLAALLKGTPAFSAAFLVALCYGTLCLAVAPPGPLAALSRAPDTSYGLYLYAFPVQGLAVWLWGPMTPLLNIALSLPITLLLALASWHFVERPALRRLRRTTAPPTPATGIRAAPSAI